MININDIKNIQRYQYDRRHLVGWRIAVFQCLTFGLLNFKGLGFYRMALKGNFQRGVREAIGTLKRFIKARVGNGQFF